MTVDHVAEIGVEDVKSVKVTCSECTMEVAFALDQKWDNRTIYCPYCPEGRNILWTPNEPSSTRDSVRAVLDARRAKSKVKLVVSLERE